MLYSIGGLHGIADGMADGTAHSMADDTADSTADGMAQGTADGTAHSIFCGLCRTADVAVQDQIRKAIAASLGIVDHKAIASQITLTFDGSVVTLFDVLCSRATVEKTSVGQR